MTKEVKIYTKAKCPKCEILKKKLTEKEVEYTEITDIDSMVKMDIQEVPMMQLGDEPPLTFGEAVRKVNNL